MARSGIAGHASRQAFPARARKGITLGDELSCQVAYAGDARLELFPSAAKPGDCGTLVFAAGTLFAPSFGAHESTSSSSIGTSTPFTPVSQSPVGGTGTSASPFKVTTVAQAGASGLRISQDDSYVVGQESYRTDTTIANQAPTPVDGILYRAGDCYLQNSDVGFGFVDPAAGAVGCSTNANNSPPARIEQWYPITPGNQYMQATYSQVWGHIATHTPFPNTTRATESLDNGAGISWRFSLAPGASKTFSHYTTFSPTGNAGPPMPPPPPPPPSRRRRVGSGPTASSTRHRATSASAGGTSPSGSARSIRPILAVVTIKMPKTTRVLRARRGARSSTCAACRGAASPSRSPR